MSSKEEATTTDEPVKKRQRVTKAAETAGEEENEEEEADIRSSTPIAELPRELEVHFLQFLTWNELNEFACVSKQSQEARAYSSLDQTREGTIRIKPDTTWSTNDFFRQMHRWSDIFQGNRTQLRLEGLKYLARPKEDFWEYGPPLFNVRSVAFSQGYFSVGHFLHHNLPNVETLDLGPHFFTKFGIWQFFSTYGLRCRRIRTIRYSVNSSVFNSPITYCGSCFRTMASLRELYLDDSRFLDRVPGQPELMSEVRDRLERVGLKDTTFSGEDKLSQDELINFVRKAPNLRWFRSDLSAENIAMLQRERPEITFLP